MGKMVCLDDEVVVATRLLKLESHLTIVPPCFSNSSFSFSNWIVLSFNPYISNIIPAKTPIPLELAAPASLNGVSFVDLSRCSVVCSFAFVAYVLGTVGTRQTNDGDDDRC